MQEEGISGIADNRVELMEAEAEEMLYAGEIKEKLWIKMPERRTI